ncbi:hypothetical protein V8G54_018712 [Vigna mungo]|uniref:Uncharacterized protein n=1 Tax=Vigna mungo TaxID=3915 RepID=A0AAQ3N9P0_VIGMU
MIDEDVVFNDGIAFGEIDGVEPGLSVATSEAKSASAANNGHFPNRFAHDHVSGQHAYAAAVEVSVGEGHGHNHHKPHLSLRYRSVNPLGLPHEFGVGFGSGSQGVVHGDDGAEGKGILGFSVGLGDNDHAGVGPGDYVVEEEVKMSELVLTETH